MKKILLLLTFFIVLSCNDKEDQYIEPINIISACGVDDPLNQIDWLHSMVLNGKDPSKISFIENVWVKNFEDEDVIVLDFGLTSSLFSPYDCLGNQIEIDDKDFFNSLSDNDLIYKYK